jgi:hypothetical protein
VSEETSISSPEELLPTKRSWADRGRRAQKMAAIKKQQVLQSGDTPLPNPKSDIPNPVTLMGDFMKFMFFTFGYNEI